MPYICCLQILIRILQFISVTILGWPEILPRPSTFPGSPYFFITPMNVFDICRPGIFCNDLLEAYCLWFHILFYLSHLLVKLVTSIFANIEVLHLLTYYFLQWFIGSLLPNYDFTYFFICHLLVKSATIFLTLKEMFVSVLRTF